MAAFTGSGHHRRSKARWPDVSYCIKAAVANRPICITSFGSLGSSPAGHRARITTARHSEAANSGAKRETGRCAFESCRSPTGRKGPQPAVTTLLKMVVFQHAVSDQGSEVPKLLRRQDCAVDHQHHVVELGNLAAGCFRRISGQHISPSPFANVLQPLS
jgi:hypothetical protein